MATAKEILATLKRLGREQGVQPQALLTRFGLERFMYRLSQWEITRPEALTRGVPATAGCEPDGFTLKGAWCFVAWGGEAHRPTQDIDLRRVGDASEARLRQIFTEACAIDGADDVVFEPATLEARLLPHTDVYAGVQLSLRGVLGGKTRLKVKADVVPGDVVVPRPRARSRLSTLVPGLPEPLLFVYSRESVLAEKLHAMAKLGMLNSRLKDYWDLYHLALDPRGFDGPTLCRAVRMTFAHRDRERPPPHLPGLSDAYIAAHNTQWAYQRPLPAVVTELRRLLVPLLLSTSSGAELTGRWDYKAGWLEPSP